MIDAVVYFVVQKAKDYLVQEASFLGGVKNEVEWLTRELKFMSSFIEDAEEKGDNNHLMCQWISEVRDIAYETEDVLDKYMLQFHEEGALDAVRSIDAGEASQRQPGCLDIGEEIEGLKERIKELSRQRQTYGLQDVGSNNREESNSARIINLRERRRTTPLRAKRNIVGLANEADELLDKLVDDRVPSRLIISIYGMGGLGKTTLAGKLYHNEIVQNRFQHHAWVYVSQGYNTRDILQKIAKSFKICNDEEELRKMNEEDLEDLLFTYLTEEGHSYLLVMDDVWEKEVWEALTAALPDNHNGSRVIVTTRVEEVAICSDKNTHCHQLRNLNSVESLQLFCMEVYGNPSQELMDCEKEIVEKCKGLPLAIVVLAGLLFGERNSQQVLEAWQRLKKKDSINDLLSLSFNDLSSHLKLCFLYLGLFPKDYSIDAGQVIRLWVAEGLIKQDDRLILEDVARRYLNELANKSLIQVEETSFGKIKNFRLHDLLRDLALRKGEDIKFLLVDSSNTNPASSSNLIRRLAVYNGVEGYLSLQNHSIRRLRSLLIFNNENEDVKELLRHVAIYSKLLSVLHIDQGSFPGYNAVIPKESETLIHLRYLMLKGFSTMELQSSISNFKTLQTLDLRESLSIDDFTFFFKAPSQICELKELRHLIGFFKEEVQIDNLTNLQTLYGISLQSWMKINSEMLSSLQELTIVEDMDEAEDMEFTFGSIGKLKSLRALRVCRGFDRLSPFISLRPLSNCQHLTSLWLEETIGTTLLKEMNSFVPRLEHLTFSISGATMDDILLKCENLKNLVSLDVLGGEYEGPQRIKCKSSGFLQLQTLSVDFEGEIEEWLVEDGAMPKLRSLKTEPMHEFIIPERFRSIWTPL